MALRETENKERYGLLWYFLEWSIETFTSHEDVSKKWIWVVSNVIALFNLGEFVTCRQGFLKLNS